MSTTINEQASAPWKMKHPALAGGDTTPDRQRSRSMVLPFCILIAVALAFALVGALVTPPEFVSTDPVVLVGP